MLHQIMEALTIKNLLVSLSLVFSTLYADTLVLDSYKINIPNYPYAYNPTLSKDELGYTLFFRYDPPKNRDHPKRKAYIGKILLDENFKPQGEATLINTKNEASEDPRCFRIKEKTYISYSHIKEWQPKPIVDMELLELGEHPVALQYKESRIEKNWVPLVYNDDLYFIYQYNPYTLLKVSDISSGEVELVYKNRETNHAINCWEKNWGKIRGGTPAIEIEDSFVAFFHSSYRIGKNMHYVIGAATFEKTPPFTITKISKEPIVYKEMYQEKITNFKSPYIKQFCMYITFPSGVIEKDNQLYVVCGDNDIGIHLLVIDKNALIRSLENVSNT